MATLDDKLLGEKMQNYCSSSSEDEEEKDDKVNANDNDTENGEKTIKGAKFISEAELKEEEKWNGTSKNTGPKGVIKDWQRYKQLESKKTVENEKERKKLIKKIALTCKTDLEEKDLELKKESTIEQTFEEELLNDDFFDKYLKSKLEEMQKRVLNLPKFGKMIELTNESFINEIDKEQKNVTIIIHIYDNKINECKIMNDCLQALAEDYQVVKFCKVRSNEITLSEKFRKMGCPTLLAYKNGELIGNFVRLNDEFGEEFFVSDVETFLLEHSLLPMQEITSIRSSKPYNNESDSSDS